VSHDTDSSDEFYNFTCFVTVVKLVVSFYLFESRCRHGCVSVYVCFSR
jgi:hypothetical protein